MKRWLGCVLWLVASLAFAQQPATSSTTALPPPIRVRVHQEPAGTLMQGGTSRIQVDVLTTDFFTDAPVLPQLHVDGAYLALSDETPGHLVETVDGQTWSGVSRTYLVTPLMSGRLEIPSFEITAHLGPSRTAVAVQTQPLGLAVEAIVLPAGVTEALIARSLKMTQTILPADGTRHVGDTVTRRIELSAEGAPAMMLPPTSFAALDGLTLYPSSPVVRDAVDNHGGFVGGTRVDTASYVIDHRGRYTLPPVTVRWMDSDTRQWREASVPGVSFHAWWGAPNKPRFALPQRGFMPRVIAWFSSDAGILLLVLAIAGGMAWYFRAARARAWQHVKAWRYRRRHAEVVAWRAVRRQRHATSAAALSDAVDAWVRRAADDGAPTTVAAWARRFGDAALASAWDAVQHALYGQGDPPWAATAVVDGLARARGQWKRARRRWHRKPALPPLNPV